ncbi:MAG: methionine--tRNA ligase [Candidatus Moranbacteria bacterium RIFOXYA12_FULL_35_19]|nr:MAG: Methionine-tRNA ligase [Candidatus Moranbacteria bacterium GW2011_GWF2_35_39]OGI35758.1 MAG: methionine--tRNA ligase [Candidatus Moranbacteria bacterium RIFOXYA12_FULL_35_19]
MNNKFYITTTLPYINANPHIGYAREIIEADVLARFHRGKGDDVFFNTGVDEHGQKIYEKAKELESDPQKYCDEMAAKFDDLKEALNLSYDNFIRTTDASHVLAVQEFWKRCEKNGDIYKKNYKVKYCVGCELEKTDSELVDGKCPDHPNMELEIIEEENYFFRYSAFQEKLTELYKNNSAFVLPEKRFNEVKAFLERGLQDFSISRLKDKMPWGVPVPDDENQVIYVWFDALVNYISAIGWPEKTENFEKWWPAVQLCGKDNLRPQSAMWQAMLLAANLPPSAQIFVNGFITVNSQKMSKSLDNVISPYEMVEKFGIDGTRYLLLAGPNFGEDFDITWEKLIEKYNADLANGLGNLVSRVIKLAEGVKDKPKVRPLETKGRIFGEFSKLVEKLELGQSLEYIWKIIDEDNKFIGDNKPWELVKTNQEKFEEVMQKLLEDLNLISELLISFMPETSQKIKKALETKKLEEVLFQRIK